MEEKGKLSLEAYKGVRDFYPEDEAVQKYMFAKMRAVVERFGYSEYHASILEPAELYRSKTSAEIVNEQTYTFVDRGEREVTLRPEMTPTVARMVAARRRELAFPLRWYSIPNVFRYERPQRGRLREHWQLNLDLFGSSSRAADAEVILIAHQMLLEFGAKEEDFEIRLNSRAALDEQFDKLGLSTEVRNNVRSLIDKKGKMPEEDRLSALKKLTEGLYVERTEESPDVAEVRYILSKEGVGNAVYDPGIVRGFDYYTGVVFEVFDTRPDNMRSLFGGGRYDNLLSLFGNEQVPAAGFGMGDVTLRDFLEVRGLIPPYRPAALLYIGAAGEEFAPEAQRLAKELRDKGIPCSTDFGEKKVGDQKRMADKQGIPFFTVVGADEIQGGIFNLSSMADGEEYKLPRAELSSFLLQR